MLCLIPTLFPFCPRGWGRGVQISEVTLLGKCKTFCLSCALAQAQSCTASDNGFLPLECYREGFSSCVINELDHNNLGMGHKEIRQMEMLLISLLIKLGWTLLILCVGVHNWESVLVYVIVYQFCLPLQLKETGQFSRWYRGRKCGCWWNVPLQVVADLLLFSGACYSASVVRYTMGLDWLSVRLESFYSTYDCTKPLERIRLEACCRSVIWLNYLDLRLVVFLFYLISLLLCLGLLWLYWISWMKKCTSEVHSCFVEISSTQNSVWKMYWEIV